MWGLQSPLSCEDRARRMASWSSVFFPSETVLSSAQALVIDMGWEWSDSCYSEIPMWWTGHIGLWLQKPLNFCAYRLPWDYVFGCNRKFCLISTTLTGSVEIVGASKVGGKKEIIYQVMNCQEYFSDVGFPLDSMPDFPQKPWSQAEQRNFKGLKWGNEKRTLDKRENLVLNKICLAFWSIGVLPF